jgi:branched-subunit amino acid aminotransferase/4-amino-4-deoxychorismate lyase
MGLIFDQDWGVLYGCGLYETMRVYSRTAFLLEEHIDRLLGSAVALGFATVPSREELLARIETVCDASSLPEAVVRLTVTFGNPEAGIVPAVFASEREIPYAREDFAAGVPVAIASAPRNEQSLLVRHKTVNYMENLLYWRQGMKRGFRETLFFNTRGRLAEGSRSNVFVVKNGEVMTPATDCGILAGITRRVVIHLLKSAGIRVAQGDISRDDLFGCSECFLTNSVMQILPVRAIEGHSIAGEVPGRVTRTAAALYEAEMQRRLQPGGARTQRLGL